MERLYSLRDLFAKYLHGEASEAEKNALKETLDEFSDEELIDVLEPLVAATQRDDNFRKEDWETAIRAILQHKESPAFTVVRKGFFSRRSLWWSAAAVFICLIIAGALFYRNGTSQPVQPGSDRALLTLADGSTIVLEKADTGQLAEQGTVKVLKLGNGLLSYASAEKPGANKNEPQYNMLTVPRGGRYQVELPDGSDIVLNSASSLRYPTAFTGSSREVELTGEAYFEIAQDKAHPFAVRVNGLKVDVLGTRFNVMAYKDEDAILTTLVQGAVKLTSGTASKQIAPGEQAAIIQGSNKFTVAKPDLQEVLAWKDGKFWFSDAKITSIMRQISRWYDVDIKFKGTIPTAEFNGVFLRKARVTELLEVLEITKDVHFLIEGRQITVVPGAR